MKIFLSSFKTTILCKHFDDEISYKERLSRLGAKTFWSLGECFKGNISGASFIEMLVLNERLLINKAVIWQVFLAKKYYQRNTEKETLFCTKL